MMKRR